MTNDSTATDNVIELRVPSLVAHASIVRLLAASLAADVGFTVDHIDDIRLAVNEVFACAVAGTSTPGDTVMVQFEPRPDDFVVRIGVHDGREPIALDDLARSITRAAVDDVRTDGHTVTLTKHRLQPQLDDR